MAAAQESKATSFGAPEISSVATGAAGGPAGGLKLLSPTTTAAVATAAMPNNRDRAMRFMPTRRMRRPARLHKGRSSLTGRECTPQDFGEVHRGALGFLGDLCAAAEAVGDQHSLFGCFPHGGQ